MNLVQAAIGGPKGVKSRYTNTANNIEKHSNGVSTILEGTLGEATHVYETPVEVYSGTPYPPRKK